MICQSFSNSGNTPPPSELSLFTAIALAVISITATSGNLSVAITILKDPLSKLHNSFNYFLLSLALSDLLLGIVTMPVGVASLVQEYLGHEKVLTEAFHLTLFMSGTASLLSLIALSIDRFVAVTYSTKYKTLLTGYRCFVACMCIWLFSISFPFLYFLWDYIGYMMFFAHSAIFVALVIMIITQIRTKHFMNKQNKSMVDNISSSAAPSSSKEAAKVREKQLEKKMSRVYLLILVFFVCVYTPAVIMTYVLLFCHSCDCTVRHVLRDLAFLMVSSNSCVNPFIYAFRVGSFRASLRAAFCRGCQSATYNAQSSKQSATQTRSQKSQNEDKEIRTERSGLSLYR